MCTSTGLPAAHAWGESEVTVSRESVINGQSVGTTDPDAF
jgi:hypothetical protein